MNEAIDINKENQKPVASIEYEFARQRERAIMSPIISDNQQYFPGEFVRVYADINSRLAVGIIVLFLDGDRYKHPNKSFYPYWVIQCGYVTVTEKPSAIRISLLTKKQKNAINKAYGYAIGQHGIGDLTVKRLTATDAEWQVPFSESDIELLDQAFRDIIRR